MKKELSENDIKKLRELRFWICTTAALAFGACAIYPLHKIEWLSQLGGGVLFISLLCAVSIDVKLPREKYRDIDFSGGQALEPEQEQIEEKQKEGIELWTK